jgi:stress response protein YsnF
MAQTVIGIFDRSEAVQNAVERLTASGLTMDNIDISRNVDRDDRSYASGTSSESGRTGSGYGDNSSDNRGDGLGDRISRFFSNLFDDDDETERYSTVARKGTIISVHAETSEVAERAAEIMDECGAVDVDERANQYEISSSGAARIMSNESSGNEYDKSLRSSGSISNESSDTMRSEMTDRTSDDNDTNRSIPVIEEELHVGKREVERGGMRLRSRIIERPVEESLRLREEHVTIDRTPVNRPASEADFNTFREGEIEVRERSEIPVVNKEARVVEEVNVRKDVREREETVRDTVRKTDVEVESLDDNMSETTKTRSGSRKKL